MGVIVEDVCCLVSCLVCVRIACGIDINLVLLTRLNSCQRFTSKSLFPLLATAKKERTLSCCTSTCPEVIYETGYMVCTVNSPPSTVYVLL